MKLADTSLYNSNPPHSYPTELDVLACSAMTRIPVHVVLDTPDHGFVDTLDTKSYLESENFRIPWSDQPLFLFYHLCGEPIKADFHSPNRKPNHYAYLAPCEIADVADRARVATGAAAWMSGEEFKMQHT